jgi:hypothetical protein
MRAVERTPWAERRSVRHDEICLAIARMPDLLLRALGAPRNVARVLLEAPCGTGFCDVLIESADRTRALFVEVKTDAERASGVDVIRQLRWYASQRGGYDVKRLVCVCESDPGPLFRELLERAEVSVLLASDVEGKRT